MDRAISESPRNWCLTEPDLPYKVEPELDTPKQNSECHKRHGKFQRRQVNLCRCIKGDGKPDTPLPVARQQVNVNQEEPSILNSMPIVSEGKPSLQC